MSLIQHGYFPRSKFDLENWLGQTNVGGGRDYFSTLDIFDAFDDFDHMLSRNMEWLQRPSFIEPLPMLPRIPDKYRVTVDVTGYTPKSIKTEFKEGNLIVSANEEHKSDKTGDYMVQQFKKTFKLPKNAETDKMASFVAGGQLVVEVPLRVARTGTTGEDLFPYMVDNKDGTKTVKMICTVPQGIEPNKINVTCKDRDLIIRAEDKMEKPDYKSKIMYYKRCTFPELTDFTEMKCMLDNGKLLVEAPINPTLQYTRRIPIEQKVTTGTPRAIVTQGV